MPNVLKIFSSYSIMSFFYFKGHSNSFILFNNWKQIKISMSLLFNQFHQFILISQAGVKLPNMTLFLCQSRGLCRYSFSESSEWCFILNSHFLSMVWTTTLLETDSWFLPVLRICQCNWHTDLPETKLYARVIGRIFANVGFSVYWWNYICGSGDIYRRLSKIYVRTYRLTLFKSNVLEKFGLHRITVTMTL